MKKNMDTFMCFLISFSFVSSFLVKPTVSDIYNFLYAGCTQLKYSPGSVYESNVNSILTSLVNSAATSNFNDFKISLPGSTQSDVVYGLYQCRGDLSSGDCSNCVARAVSQLGNVCADTSGGALQLDGCFVKYDNVTFLGVEDKTVVLHKCGPSIAYDSNQLTRLDAVMGYLTAGGQYFRVGGSGDVQGKAQCVQDLSGGQCQDCVSDAIGRLKTECGTAAWGDMFLAKCYARFTERGYQPGSGNDHNNNGDDVDKSLAIIIGGIAGVALLVFFLSAFNRLMDKKGRK